MFKRDDVLTNPVDFDNAIFFSIPIEVTLKTDGTHQETGVIEAHNENKIKMNGGSYLKRNCIFKVGYMPNHSKR